MSFVNSYRFKKETSLIPVEKIIHLYKMENNFNDSVGGNNGAGSGVTFADGLVGKKAIIARSANPEINIGNSTDFAINNDSTIMFLYLKVNNKLGIIFNYGNYTSWGLLRQDTNGVLSFLYSPHPSGSLESFSTPFIQPSTCVITLVRDHTNSIYKIYRDKTVIGSHIPTTTRAKQSTGDFVIGDGYLGSPNIQLDEFTIFNDALTEEEIFNCVDSLLAGQSLI